ncbi:MAG: peptidoglycan editing factor PgeF [Candidatus Sedimenticola sp. (ex Thyasira tokunagai)]
MWQVAEVIVPDWPAPTRVRALTTTRRGGCSRAPYESLNLGTHVGDNPERVANNRALLRQQQGLPADPLWLEQVHGCAVAECSSNERDLPIIADAAFSDRPDKVCAVMTADCLPLLLCNRSGTKVAAVHAGWRGLAAGVIEAAVNRFDEPGESILAWLGPAIGPECFEVGGEVRERFLSIDQQNEAAFQKGAPGHWQADIYKLARIRLGNRGIGFIAGGDYCTVSDSDRFFSYRRDGVTGRMASLIWFA